MYLYMGNDFGFFNQWYNLGYHCAMVNDSDVLKVLVGKFQFDLSDWQVCTPYFRQVIIRHIFFSVCINVGTWSGYLLICIILIMLEIGGCQHNKKKCLSHVCLSLIHCDTLIYPSS